MATYTGSDKRLAYLFERTEDMQGATASTDGTAGIVPAPEAGDDEKFLRGDGTWAEVQSGGVIYPTTETKIGTFNGYDLYRQVVTINATDWNADASISGMYYTDINLANIAIINFDVSWFSPTTSGSSLSGYHKYPCEELHDMTFTPYTTSLRIYAMIPNTSNIGTTQALTIDYIKIA